MSHAWSDRTAGLKRMQSRQAASCLATKVFVLVPVAGVCCPLNLHVPDYPHASGSLKVNDPPWSRFPFDGREELPEGGSRRSEVVLPGPPLALGRVSSARPSPELPADAGIDERQPSSSEKRRDGGENLVPEQFLRTTRDDKAVRVADHVDLGAPRNGVSHCRLQAIQGHVRQHGEMLPPCRVPASVELSRPLSGTRPAIIAREPS